ncbi:hypothetical protein EJB05_47211, partial [Eragrostis curvula]
MAPCARRSRCSSPAYGSAVPGPPCPATKLTTTPPRRSITFTANLRKKQADAKDGYYGNLFTFGLAVATCAEVANDDILDLVRALVREAKARVPSTFMDGTAYIAGEMDGRLPGLTTSWTSQVSTMSTSVAEGSDTDESMDNLALAPTQRGGRRSKVWEHFERDLVNVDGDLKGVCKYCQLKMQTKSGTSSLLSHIAVSCPAVSKTRELLKYIDSSPSRMQSFNALAVANGMRPKSTLVF